MHRTWRILGAVAGVALFAAAVWFALAQVDFTTLRSVPPAYLAGLAGLVAANILLTGGLFWVITLSFDASPRVGLIRMTELIAVSGLLNYVPAVRAGLWGRAAYLKLKHGLPVRQSAVILLAVLTLAGMVTGLVLAAWLMLGVHAVAGASAGGAIVLSTLLGLVAGRLLKRDVTAGWSWLVLRYADTLVMAARLWLAFAAVGSPIGFNEALVAGAVAQVVRLTGLTPNGLGLSEWVIAWLVARSGPGVDVAVLSQLPAALLDRAVEVVVSLAAGAGAAWRLRGVAGNPRREESATDEHGGVEVER